MANRFTLGQTDFEKTESAKAYEAKTGMDVSIAENMKFATGQSANFSKAATSGSTAVVKTATSKTSKTTPLPSTTKVGDKTIANIKAFGAGGNAANNGTVKYDNTITKKTPSAAEAAASQAEYNRLMSIDLQRQKAAIERQQKLAANSRTSAGMINAGGTFVGGSATTNVKGTTAAEQRLAELQRDYNLAEEVQRYTRYEKQLSELSDKDREIVQTLAEYNVHPYTTKHNGVPIVPETAVNLQRIVEKSGYTADEVKALVDAQVRVNNKEDYLAKQEKWAATARGEDNIGGITGAAWASAASVGENLVSGIGYLDVWSQNMANVGKEEKAPIDYYTGAMSHAAAANAARSEVSNLIIEKSKAKNPDKENAGQILSFLYQTGMSMADSGVIAASALLGVPATAGTLLLGGAAASSTLMDAHQRGLSDTQAILTATAAGVAETVFEKVSIEKLLPNLEAPLSGSIKQMVRDASKRLVEQGFVEASEEGFTTIANTAFDALINGNLSEYNQNLYRYMATMSPTEAKDAAWKDLMKGLGLDMLGGFLSGGMMAGAPNFVRVASYSNEMNVLAGQTFTAQGLLNTAVNLGVQSDTVAKVSKAVADGKSVSNATLHTLAVEVAKQSLQNSMPQVTSTIAEQLSQSGETSADAAGLVDAMSHAYMLAASNLQDVFTYEAAVELYGPTLTEAEQNLIAESDAGNQTLSRMLQVPINIKLTTEVSQEAAVSAENGTSAEQPTAPAPDATAALQNGLVLSIVERIRSGEKVSMKKAANDILADEEALAAVGVKTEGRTIPQIIRDIKTKLTELASAPVAQTASEAKVESADGVPPGEITLNGKAYDFDAFTSLMNDRGITDEGKIREMFTQAVKATTVEGNNNEARSENPDQRQERNTDGSTVEQNARVDGAAGVRAEAGENTPEGSKAGRPAQEVSPERQSQIDAIRKKNFDTAQKEVHAVIDGKDVGMKVNALTPDAADEFIRSQDPSLMAAIFDVERSGGSVTFVLGGISYQTESDITVTGNAVTIDGKDIHVQIDSGVPATQLLGHEQFHVALYTVLNREAVIDDVIANMSDTFLNDVVDRYDRPGGPYTTILGEIDVAADLHSDDMKDLMRDYVEELCCDLNGRFNRCGYDTEVFEALRAQLLDSVHEAQARVNAERATANGMAKEQLGEVKDSTGKPLFSVATMKEDLDGYMEDLRNSGLVGDGKAMTEEDLNNLYTSINSVMDYAEDHLTEIERLESYRSMTRDSRPFSPYKDNSEPHYKMALDFSTLCRKRLLTQAIIERLQSALGRAVTPQESVKIRNKIKELRDQGKKLTVACALCYVEAARLKSPKVINEFLNNRTAELKNYYSLKNKQFKNDVYNKRSGDWKEAHGLPRNATKATIKSELGAKKVAEYNKFLKKIRENYWDWLQQADPETYAEQSRSIETAEGMDASEFLSAESLAKLSKSDPTIYDAFVSKVRSATRSKAMETDVPYSRGDVNSVSDVLIEQMNEESGFRHQSWSDFQAMHLLDTVAAIIELSTRGAKMHTYTKVPDMVKLLCDTGMMINMSLIPAGNTGINEDGTLAFDDNEGMPYQEMLELRKAYPDTAGNIAIGISDEQIRLLMGSPLIDYIIPYHTSGLNADMRKRMGIREWDDFTKSQNEVGGKGPALHEWFDEKEAMLAVDGYEYMVEASKKYLSLCAELSVTPKFKQFLIDNKDGSYSLDEKNARNYWKLLVDRKMVNQVDKSVIIQKPVVPKFNTNTMLDILSNEVNSQEAIDSREAEDQIVKDILNGDGTLPKKELERARIIRDASVRYAIENTMARFSVSAQEQDALTAGENRDSLSHITNEGATKDELRGSDQKNSSGLVEGRDNYDPAGRGRAHEKTVAGVLPLTDTAREHIRRTLADVLSTNPAGDALLGTGGSIDYLIETFASLVTGHNVTGNTEIKVLFPGVTDADIRKVREMLAPGKPLLADKNLTSSDKAYFAAIKNNPKMAKELVRKAAQAAGYNLLAHHFTNADFTVFRFGELGYHVGTLQQAKYIRSVKDEGNGSIKDLYVKAQHPLYWPDVGLWNAKEMAAADPDATGLDHLTEAEREEFFDKLRQIAEIHNITDSNHALIAFLQGKGYDSIRYENTQDREDWEPIGESYILFDPEQLKSADTITRDDAGNIIPLSQRFNSKNKDTRFSVASVRGYRGVQEDNGVNAEAPDEGASSVKLSAANGQNIDPELNDLYNLLSAADKQFGNNFAQTLTSLMSQAKKVTEVPITTGVERVSNMATSQHYNKDIASASGKTKGEWLDMLTYKAQTNKDSQNRASEILYYHDPKTGKRMFLRDVNPAAYNTLLDTLRGQEAWNAVSVDTAYMIWSELKADAMKDPSKRDAFIDWTKAIREKETAMGQGVQALNKWKNVSPAGELLHAWELINKNKKMTPAQKKALYDRILKHYGEIENITDIDRMKDKVMEIAEERGTTNNIITKSKDSIIVRQAIRRALNTMNMSELRNLATASCMAMAADTRQITPGDAMRTVQVLNMLSKPSTIGKNIVGNTTFYGIDFVSMNGASLLDIMLSKITGTRSVAAEGMTLFNEASRKGFMRSAAEVLLDVNMDEDVNRYDLKEGRTFKQGGGLIERLLSAYERNMNFMLVTPDEFYKSAAKSTERRIQQLINAGKIKTSDKQYAADMANGLALYRTFQDASHISAAIQGMRDWLNAVAGFGDSGRTTKTGKTVHAFGVGDIVAPFTKVAGNLVSRGIEYSPFAIVQGVYDICATVHEAKTNPEFNPKTQAKAVMELARGINGSAIAAVFMLLVRAGLMRKADDEDDANVKALNASEGISSTQLNLDAFGRWISGESVDWRKGDVLLDVNSIEPLNILMNIGATINSWDETTSTRDKVWDIVGSLADASAELPVVQNILGAAEDLIRYNREPEEVIAEALLSTAVSSIVPNVVRGVARGMDTKVRNTYSQESVLGQAADLFKSSIPGLREKLPASLDNYGNEKEYRNKTAFGRMMNAVFNPLGINIYAQDDLSKQLEELRVATKETSFYPNKSAPTSINLDKATRDNMGIGEDMEKLKLTFEQRQLYQTTYGNTAHTTMTELVNSSLYKTASDAEKIEMLNSCKDYATELAKKAVLGTAYQEKAWVEMARTAESDYSISTAEFLVKRSEYKDSILSSQKSPKTKAAVSMGFNIDSFADINDKVIDTDNSGGISKSEVMSVLDADGNLTRDQKAFYMAQWNKNYYTGRWANPYGSPSADAQRILDEMYNEIDTAAGKDEDED